MPSTTSDAIGYAASLAVLITFLMPTIARLRLIAILSNVLFGIYGYSRGLYPVLVLHALLLPINLFRLIELRANGGLAGRRRPTVNASEYGP